ncbi:killer cell lectin-like receptor subfamily B member 1B allele B isoform X2 [Sceloporus undulatus]|uniref:killer cell lectin-like receptor subfamily B member 1B allele B isoform X2 n=1 Tax=Sceloporus undulatus TaxID=8520 RepID=UPI001C4CDCD7|nr:killer cell lectin-like receptor subfamily B member 1B allele B isoform X2 [Sceloporus undulatus]
MIALGIWEIFFKGWWTKESLHALEKIHAFQGTNSQTPSNESQQKTKLDNHQALLQYLCKSYGNHSTENSRCKLCPETWLRHKDKCYWISREKNTWNKSHHDCTAKVSQLAVIKEKAELDFIKGITDGAQLLWLGLTAIPLTSEWSWVEGSLLNDTLLQVTGAAQANSCGMLKGEKIISEACSAVTKWICETEALLV